MKKKSPQLVVTAHRMKGVMSNYQPILEKAGWQVEVNVPENQSFSSSELFDATKGATAIIVGDDEVSREYLESSRSTLKLVIKWGVGTDSIDKEVAAGFGITVMNTPGVFGGEVADMAMAYILGLSRNILVVDSGVRERNWPHPVGISLDGKVLGIIGYGDAGKNLEKRGVGFGMDIRFYDPYADLPPDATAIRSELDSLVQDADYLVLTCPSTPETRGMINRERLAQMKTSAFLSNVARGDLVEQASLELALASGEIAGAGLDVYEAEPLSATSALRGMKNVILGAHNGSNTQEALERASSVAARLVLDWQEENRA